MSGRNAETRIRGRYKEKLDEESKRKEKAAIPEDVKAKYAAWGKGEAQIKAHREKMRDDLHEMSKFPVSYILSLDIRRANDHISFPTTIARKYF